MDLDIADDEDEDDEESENTGGGRFWVWGDGEEAGLDKVKKSWEALEVSCTLEMDEGLS